MNPLPSVWARKLRGLRRLPEMARDPLGFLTSVAREQGSIGSFDFGPRRQWLLSHPDAIQSVFIEQQDALEREASLRMFKPLFGEGLVTGEGAAWARIRRSTGRVFRAKDVRAYAHYMTRAASEHPLEAGLLDLHRVSVAATQQAMLHAMFGSDTDVGVQIARSVDPFLSALFREFISIYRFAPSFLSTPSRRQARASKAELDAILRPLLARRSTPDEERVDMFSRLVTLRDGDGDPLTPDELREVVVALYFGGTDTSANALAFAGWLLAQRPDVQDALAEERRSVLGGRTATADDAKALRRHTAVLEEAMRLYPPLWSFGRRTLRAVEVEGHRIEAGDQVAASPWVVHRDPRWYPQPHAFLPERFWNEDAKPRPRTAYFPFGLGERNCLGFHFARLEMVLVLATWLNRRRLHPVPDRALELLPRATLKPAHGAWVEVEVLP